MTGGLVLGAGYVLAGLAGTSFWGILLGIGVLGGAGIGLGYVCPIAALVKWFPDKKGLITGLAVAGFGFGALIWIKLTSGFRFGPVDLTPGWTGLYGMGWTVSKVFILYGILFAVLVVLGALVDGESAGGLDAGGLDAARGVGRRGQRRAWISAPREMARTPQFWMLFLTFLVGATAGLMVIGIIELFGKEALTGSGIEAARATVIAGTAMGLFYALMNGLGRIIWGSLSDRLGRKNAISLMSLLQGDHDDRLLLHRRPGVGALPRRRGDRVQLRRQLRPLPRDHGRLLRQRQRRHELPVGLHVLRRRRGDRARCSAG